MQYFSATVSLLAVIASAGYPAFAQQAAQDEATVTPADQTQNQEIVVTGIRRSLEVAANIKRAAPNLVEAISAEDIGKFPDRNLAESLQRVTGVQITRNKGEGSGVSVRGLSENFTRTLYNGRVLTSPNGTRGFSFTSMPTDFVSTVEVSKTPTADMIDGGLSATIDVKINRPADVGKNIVTVVAEGLYETNPKKLTPHVSAFVNRVFGDGSFGVNLGVNYEKRKVIQAGFTGYGIEQRKENAANGRDYNVDGIISDTAYGFDHATTFVSDEGDFERKAIVGGLQWKPADNVNLYADGLATWFTDGFNRFEHQLRWTNIGGPNAAVRDSTVGENNLLTFLDADGVDHQSNNLRWVNKDRTINLAAGGDATFDRLTVSGEATYGRSVRNLSDFNSFAPISRASASYDLGDDFGAVPDIQYTRGYDPYDPSTFYLRSFSATRGRKNYETNKSARLDLKYDFDTSFIRSIKIGGYFGDDKIEFGERPRYFVSPQMLAQIYGTPYLPGVEGGAISAANLMKEVDYSRFVGEGLGRFLVPDYDKLFADASLDDIFARGTVTIDRTNQFIVREKVLAGYARADFATADDRISGNVGLRYVRTRLTSDGFGADIANAELQNDSITLIVPDSGPISFRNAYSNWLPSFNMRWSATDKLIVRMGIARAMTRPDLNRLSPSVAINANVRTITTQNPFLKPYLADQADLSLEYYFGRTGLLSAAVFYKDVKNFIVDTTSTETRTIKSTLTGTVTLDFRTFRPDNGAGGKIKGIELNAQLPLDMLPAPFDGFGVTSNLTLLDVSDVETVAGGPKVPIPGVSKRSYNLGAYYEKSGFGIRANYSYRSAAINSTIGTFGDGDRQNPYGQLDISANYDVSQNLSLTFNASNVTGATLKRETLQGVLLSEYDFGRRFTAGARIKF
ncbi:TonB-dependent receptor (plasmid) [Sphingobium sp. V4]|uniref:TonB-dependent receptor n=1 Tax=Sphingobium sp. V4 TaxID=3038927 RepID=UPI002557C896|nr:TonB-dependent receptor [Sphingobium sp. V4]WIW90417.1 TonB-dependent receptor [Sphingobium sp. V4]